MCIYKVSAVSVFGGKLFPPPSHSPVLSRLATAGGLLSLGFFELLRLTALCSHCTVQAVITFAHCGSL